MATIEPTTELGPWEPLELAQAGTLFEAADFRWWVTGGHALELHLNGISWRDHDDTDISICRRDAAKLFDLLAGWDLHVAAAGTLTTWTGADLDPGASQNNIWCRQGPNQPWCLDITISDGDADSWIYRRDPTLTIPWEHAVLSKDGGLPYLAPELQLLFKSNQVRTKDQHDAEAIIPALGLAQRTLLSTRLAPTHAWQELLGREMAVDVVDQLDLHAYPELLAAGRSSQAWRLVDDSQQPTGLVVRTPIANSDRTTSYGSEAAIAEQLSLRTAPVSTWQLTHVGDSLCSVGTLLPGTRVDYGTIWTDEFATGLATTLAHVHSLEVNGFGPLVNDPATRLRGRSSTWRQGVVDRWCHAAIWPFDGSSLEDHPIHQLHPTAASVAWSYEADILATANNGPIGLVHSDLHREHLLAGPNGEFTGLLDFGDAFIGALAWDFALLHWYYGPTNTAMVASKYPNGPELHTQGAVLALAVGLYKLAKLPSDHFRQQKLLVLLGEM